MAYLALSLYNSFVNLHLRFLAPKREFAGLSLRWILKLIGLVAI